MALLLAGFPVSVPGVTVNRLCASGLNAVNIAARSIRAGDGDIYIAGGVESMSRAPYSLPKAEDGFSFGNLTAYDTALGWRYPNPRMKDLHGTDSMGETAENIAITRPHLTRAVQDAFAVRSHQKAIAAIDAGRFAEEIIPVAVPQKKGDPLFISTDERPRRDTTPESLARLKPAFRKEGGTVTAGNSSGLNDGAAAVLVMSAARADQLGLKPLARIASYASAGLDPALMGMGPVPASQLALKRAGWKASDLELLEINEAFAAQACAVNQEMGWDTSKVNVNGGAIAIGHPIGASGCRILVTLLHEMQRRDARKGIASLCIGGGMGVALTVER